MDINNKKENDKNLSFLKIFLSLVIFLFLIIPSVSAIEIQLNENYSIGETLIAKISGNFVDTPNSNNIFLYQDGHIPVPTQFSVSRIDNTYYAYTTLIDKSAGNYSLKIKNVRYYQVNTILDDDLIKNFTIKNEIADFYVIPGFLDTDKDFSLKLTSLKDNDVVVYVNPEKSSSSSSFFDSLFGGNSDSEETDSEFNVTLSSGQSKNITLYLDRTLTEPTLKIINISSENTDYSIPVYMNVENTTKDVGTGNLRFSSVVFNVSLATNSNTTRVLYLENTGNDSVENITLYVSSALAPYINLSEENLSSIPKNSSKRIDITFISGEFEKNIEGQITARYLNSTDSTYIYEYSAVFLSFVKDYIPSTGDNSTNIPTDTKTCSELNGKICSSSETCSGDSVYAKDSLCCLDSCVSKDTEEKSSYGKWFGWGLVAVILIFLAWFFLKKFRKVSTPINLIQISKGKR